MRRLPETPLVPFGMGTNSEVLDLCLPVLFGSLKGATARTLEL